MKTGRKKVAWLLLGCAGSPRMLDAELGEVNDQRRAVWTGATDQAVEGDWHWPAGSPFWSGASNGTLVDGAYGNWGPGRPNNSNLTTGGEDCAVVYVAAGEDGDLGSWNDLPCEDPYAFICERF
jgi:hypothetical protein